MRVIVAGGHGQIARRFGEIASGEHDVVGLIRRPEQSPDVEAVGMTPRVVDLETAEDLSDVIGGADGVLFAAGAGPGSGAARKETVDYGAAVKCVDAAVRTGARRFLMISAMGTDDPPDDDSVFSVYLRAKSRADRYLIDSGLDWTVIRPGRLTDDPPTGRVRLARHVPRGEISRSDVAQVVAETLLNPATVGHIFEVVRGDSRIVEALHDLGPPPN